MRAKNYLLLDTVAWNMKKPRKSDYVKAKNFVIIMISAFDRKF
jgi:hypothetical protein